MRLNTGLLTVAATYLSAVSAAPSPIDPSAGMINSEPLLAKRADDITYTNNSEFVRVSKHGHDWYRYQHRVSAGMVWDTGLAAQSLAYAQKCKFAHSGTTGVGENLALGYADIPAVISAWSLERQLYNWSTPGFSSKTGHFTQVVWYGTLNVGCGRVKCSNLGSRWYVVCQYKSPGNINTAAQFTRNVKTQWKGSPSDVYTYALSKPNGKRSLSEPEFMDADAPVKRDDDGEEPMLAPGKVAGEE